MKIVDRYLLREFLVPLGYCLLAFLLITVVYDLFDNLATFVKWGTPLDELVGYYVTILPMSVPVSLPISLLLALLYCLATFAKHGELIAMRASGLSLRRLMLPYLAVGFVGSVILFLMNESLVPRAIDRAQQFMVDQKIIYREKKEATQAGQSRESEKAQPPKKALPRSGLFFYNARDRRHWMIQDFDPEKKEIQNVEILQMDDANREQSKIMATRGKFLDGRWWFFDVKVFDLQTLRITDDSRQRIMTELNETPRLLASVLKKPDQMTVKEIRIYLGLHQSLPGEKRAPFLVNLHQRFAQPWICLVMVLLGVSVGTRVGRQGPLVAVASSLVLFFVYWLVSQVSFEFGKNGYIDPVLSAWLPNLFFGTVGAAGYVNVR